MSAKAKRKSTGKRLRFSIFARDKFTCRYCGRQSDEIALVLDHVIPVSKGGTSDESNLVTCCVECNQGKADILIEHAAPTETDRLRMEQEMREQEMAAEFAARTNEARQRRLSSMVQFWCGLTGCNDLHRRTGMIVFRYVQDHGESVVYPWIESAYQTCAATAAGPALDVNMGRYISGIRRAVLEAKEETV
jgi:hypothetical protein